MKRCLFKLVLFLLLGAVVNVAVAWGFGSWCGRIDSARVPLARPATESDMAWLVALGWQPALDTEHWKHEEEVIEERYAALIRYLFVENPRSEGLHGSILSRNWYIAVSIWAGWPTKSMKGSLVYQAALERRDAGSIRSGLRSIKTGLPPHNGSPPYDRERTVGAVRLPKSNAIGGAADGHLLPLKPIPTGFAINTVFYATILSLLTLGPFTARRIIRRKRGRCIKCGYDLRGAEHEVCPECGVEL